MPPIPVLFLKRMSLLLGEEFTAFAHALEDQAISGLRVNTLKLSAGQFQDIAPFPLGKQVPWCDSAFIVPVSDVSFGKHAYHLAGLYYLQDPSAMSAVTLLDPQPGERVLDLAAAPGGKTTHLAARMQGSGLLVANEIKEKRLGHLVVNVERWGAGNVVITNETPERLADAFGAWFDRVLVDAPCSGEGMFRKDRSARLDWSPGMVEGCALRQSNILRVAANLVRPGGHLLYSTCTFAPEEDEAVIARFLAEFPEYEAVPVLLFPGFMPGRPDWMDFSTISAERGQSNTNKTKVKELENAVRLFPHRVQGEGHFVCLMRRMEEVAGRPSVRSGRGQETLARQAGRPSVRIGRGLETLAQQVVIGGGGRSQEIPYQQRGTLAQHRDREALTHSRPDRFLQPSASQERLWQDFSEEVLGVEFEAGRLRVRGERLYLVPMELPDLGNLRVPVPGVWLGTFKKERFEPAHPLALFLKPGQTRNVLDLSSKNVGERRSPLHAYLRGESIPSEGMPGWILVTVDGWPLGWGKRVQGIVKNHYPKGWQVYS